MAEAIGALMGVLQSQNMAEFVVYLPGTIPGPGACCELRIVCPINKGHAGKCSKTASILCRRNYVSDDVNRTPRRIRISFPWDKGDPASRIEGPVVHRIQDQLLVGWSNSRVKGERDDPIGPRSPQTWIR